MTRTAAFATALLLITSTSAFAEDKRAEQGKKIFTEQAQPSCTICHTLEDAGATGAIGPNLDELKPSPKQVREAVRAGVGVMPGYEDSLSGDDIEAVAYYVATVTGNAGE
ncbi:c-type cytochrome [Marinobacter sp. DUT-3]|uniref:SorU family sulfite dehydrogenase c-type cytochrome subunit n=1 Tax=unclassified Marinobacter TaxID=83889 RepID=UPI00387B63E3